MCFDQISLRPDNAQHSLRICLSLVLASFVFVAPVRSQVLISMLLGDKVSSEKFHLELNVGANISNLSELGSTEWTPGFMMGIGGEWRFAGNFFLQPELVPFYTTGANNLSGSLVDLPPEVDELITEKQIGRTLKYFSIPILIKYGAMNRQLHIGAGPQFGFLTSANERYDAVINNSITINENIKDAINSTDIGIVFNLSYKFKPTYGTGINLRYYLGLTDTIKDNSGDAVLNQVFSIFVSVAIGNDPSASE